MLILIYINSLLHQIMVIIISEHVALDLENIVIC